MLEAEESLFCVSTNLPGISAKRWEPLGSADVPQSSCSLNPIPEESDDSKKDAPLTEEVMENMRRLEKEQEQLNNSLLALTSHFAQVQFRLRQIIDSESSEKTDLLRELEEFAFRGVPDLTEGDELASQKDSEDLRSTSRSAANRDIWQISGTDERIEKHRRKHLELIERLKCQLESLESYAFETGELSQPPTQQRLEKQQIVLEKLQERLDLELSRYDRLSMDEFRSEVDKAILQAFNPAKTKDRLVDQLKTQIADLENFIEFLHFDAPVKGISNESTTLLAKHRPGLTRRCVCACPLHNEISTTRRRTDSTCTCTVNKCPRPIDVAEQSTDTRKRRQTTLSHIQRAILMLQMFAAAQFGCGLTEEVADSSPPSSSSTNTLAPVDEKRRHWGDLRARLEVCVERVVEKCTELRSRTQQRLQRRQQRLDHQRHVAGRMAAQLANEGRARRLSSANQGSVCSSPAASTISAGPHKPHTIKTTRDNYRAHKSALNGSSAANHRLSSAPDSRFHPIGRSTLAHTHMEPRSRGDGTETVGERVEELPSSSRLDAEEEQFFPQKMDDVEDLLDEYHSDTEEYIMSEGQRELASIVRRDLCPALAGLLEHGLVGLDVSGGLSRTLLPITSCLSSRRSSHSVGYLDSWVQHAWQLFERFFHIKRGPEFNQSAARKLAQSFDLEVVGGRAIGNKQQLLSTIDQVVQSHAQFRRSDDAKFKALVSVALNEKRLVSWLKLVVNCPALLDHFYEWSYTARTGWKDAFQCLDRLSQFDFHIPRDLAVRQFTQIRDVY